MSPRDFILRQYVRSTLTASALGSVSVAMGLGCQLLNGDTTTGTHSLLVEIEDACPSVEEAKDLIVGDTKCTDPVLEITDVNEFIERTEHYDQDYPWDTASAVLSETHETCVYGVTMKTRPGEACIIGRPLTEAGHQITARLVKATNDRWSDRGSRPDVAGLNKSTRAILAKIWGRSALGEQASVGSFARFTTQLMAHGAPPELLRRSQQAGIDEVDHATATFAITSAYIGEQVGPGALPLEPVPTPSLADFVSATITEGCIGETLAVLHAVEQFKVTKDKTVRRVLAKIIQDEQNHAELAYDTVKWALSLGDPEVLKAAESAFASAYNLVPNGTADPILSEAEMVALAEHGFVARETLTLALRRGVDEVILPTAERLLSPYRSS